MFWTWLVLSALCHVLLFLLFAALSVQSPIVEFTLPQNAELGLLDDPGVKGAPAPAAPPAEEKRVKPKPKPAPKLQVDEPSGELATDAGVPEAAHAQADAPTAESETLASTRGADGGVAAQVDGAGASPIGGGEGLGFGAGGFGSGRGGPPGVVIGLHADLQRIRSTSLILEVGALLDIIPEWQRLLEGSGIDALHDLSRVFVATPNLQRSSLVVSARFQGGEAFVGAAAQRMARARNLTASFADQHGMRVAPWRDRGPTERVVGLVAPDQFVIARPDDVARVLSVSAALARRHLKQTGMERLSPPASLLAMYENEAAALSVEGVQAFVTEAHRAYVPLGLRLSLRHLDEYRAELRVFGYYASSAQASVALSHLKELRVTLAEHPQVAYLGFRAALDEATFTQEGATLVAHSTLTMHHVRYLMGYVSKALKPR